MNKKNNDQHQLISQLEEIVKQKETLSIIISELRLCKNYGKTVLDLKEERIIFSR